MSSIKVQDSVVYKIPEYLVESFKEKFEELNKRARKLGVAESSYVLGDSYGEWTTEESSQKRRYKVITEVTVSGTSPKLAGWVFLGSVDFSDPAVKGFLLHLMPLGEEMLSKEVIEDIKRDPYSCDHCGKVRRRAKTYIVWKPADGDMKLVGSMCLKDFMGFNASPDQIAAYFENLERLIRDLDSGEEEGMGGGYRGPMIAPREEFLVAVATFSRIGGYLSSAAAKEAGDVLSTGEIAWMAIYPMGKMDLEVERKFREERNEEDKKTAEEVEAYVALMFEGKTFADLSNYEANLMAAWETGLVSSKTNNLIASAYGSFLRAMERDARGKQSLRSTHIGTIGSRTEFIGRCIMKKEFETAYGFSTLIKFATQEGAVLAWFASGNAASHNVKVGKIYELKCTVKTHKEYKGTLETQLSRCKIMAELSE